VDHQLLDREEVPVLEAHMDRGIPASRSGHDGGSYGAMRYEYGEH
jgi:hypothetical protein